LTSALNAFDVKRFAREKGADLVGISSCKRFKGTPKGHRPWDILPESESVIVLALNLPQSIVRTIPSFFYDLSYNYLNQRLEVLANEISTFIENHGFGALPLPPTEPDYPREIKIIQEEPEPKVYMMASFSHRHAAILAGLAEMSAASFVVSPGFGPRIRFTSVITTAELEQNSMLSEDLNWGSICRPEICSLACVKICPALALKGDGKIDQFKCRNYRDPERYDLDYFKELKDLIQKDVPIMRRALIMRKYPKNIETCGLCVKACPIGINPRFGVLERDIRKSLSKELGSL